MKKSALVGILALSALLLTGCKDTLDGEVTAKYVDPGYTSITQQPIYGQQCSGTGTSRTCTQVQTGSYPVIYQYPDCYKIAVRGETKDATGTTCLDEDRWAAIKVGDHYTGEDVPRPKKKVG